MGAAGETGLDSALGNDKSGGGGAGSGGFCRGEDLFDDLGFGVGVGVHVGPVLPCEVALGLFVPGAVGGVGTKAVAESEITGDLGAVFGVDVDMGVEGWRAEHAVLMEVGLADAEDVAGGLHVREVGRFIGGIGDDDEDVDDGFGGEVGDGGGADVFDLERGGAEGDGDSLGVVLEHRGPGGIVIGDENGRWISHRVVLSRRLEGAKTFMNWPQINTNEHEVNRK
jgi:hypothetical protein